MWPALILVLLVGLLIGYLCARLLMQRPSPLLSELDQLSEENQKLQRRERELEQELEDLARRFEEEQKARAYYQKKAENCD